MQVTSAATADAVAATARRVGPWSIPAAATAAPTAPGFEPELLLDSHVALPRLLKAIGDAKHVINISMYSWIDSGSGSALARLVERKAREGVEVNIMLDGRGSVYGPGLPGSRLVKRFREAGVNVIVNKSLVPVLDGPVDHCKVYSIDGETGFIGGMNLSKTYDTWHDAMATLDRYGAVQAGRDFLARWTARGGTVSDVNRRLVLQPATEPVRGSVKVIANRPGGPAPITDAYLAAIATAKRRVWVETPFLGSQALVDALVGAARRGIDVRLLTDGPTTEGAVPGINLLGAGFYGQLVRAGVKVYQQQQMTHSKVLLADEQATVGSFNLTLRSQERHYEISMQSSAPGFVGQVQGMFDADIGAARLVTEADLAKPGMKFLEALQRWLRIQY